MLLVCFAVMLPSATGYWFWPNMSGNVTRLLGEHFLQEGVLSLDTEVAYESLRIVNNSHVDSMVQRHTIPIMTAKQIKCKIRDKVLLAALEHMKAQVKYEHDMPHCTNQHTCRNS